MTNKFLIKLKKEERLELVEPSENICDSYLEKSNNCLKATGMELGLLINFGQSSLKYRRLVRLSNKN